MKEQSTTLLREKAEAETAKIISDEEKIKAQKDSLEKAFKELAELRSNLIMLLNRKEINDNEIGSELDNIIAKQIEIFEQFILTEEDKSKIFSFGDLSFVTNPDIQKVITDKATEMADKFKNANNVAKENILRVYDPETYNPFAEQLKNFPTFINITLNTTLNSGKEITYSVIEKLQKKLDGILYYIAAVANEVDVNLEKAGLTTVNFKKPAASIVLAQSVETGGHDVNSTTPSVTSSASSTHDEKKEKELLEILDNASNDKITTEEAILQIRTLGINIVDKDGNSPIHLAIMKGLTALANGLLKEQGIDVNIANKEGKKALHLAAEKQLFIVLENILKNKTLEFTLVNDNDSKLLQDLLNVNNKSAIDSVLLLLPKIDNNHIMAVITMALDARLNKKEKTSTSAVILKKILEDLNLGKDELTSLFSIAIGKGHFANASVIFAALFNRADLLQKDFDFLCSCVLLAETLKNNKKPEEINATLNHLVKQVNNPAVIEIAIEITTNGQVRNFLTDELKKLKQVKKDLGGYDLGDEEDTQAANNHTKRGDSSFREKLFGKSNHQDGAREQGSSSSGSRFGKLNIFSRTTSHTAAAAAATDDKARY